MCIRDRVVAASSINLLGTMRAINLTNLGSGWVVSTPPTGSSYTRRVGTLAEAAECFVERTGKVVFYTGFVPDVYKRQPICRPRTWWTR